MTQAVLISLKSSPIPPHCCKLAALLAQNHKGYIKVALENACIDEQDKSACKAR